MAGPAPKVEEPNDWLRLVQSGALTEYELRLILLTHINRSTSSHPNLSVIDYQLDGSTVLTLSYNDKELVSIDAVALTDDLKKSINLSIRSELDDSQTIVLRCFALGVLPMNGYWRYKDLFQIAPVPSGAPAPNPAGGWAGPNYPLILEVAVKDSSSDGVRLQRFQLERRSIQLVLSLLIRGGLRLSEAGRNWAIRFQDGTEKVELLNQGYVIPGFKWNARRFRSLSKKCGELPTATYYASESVSSHTERLSIPDNLESVLDQFYGLPPASQERFLRACFWYDQYRHATSSSAAFHALVQSIETLANPPGIQSGMTGRFKQFVGRYASGTDNQIQKDLYSLRSKISHAGYLISTDLPMLVASPGLVVEVRQVHDMRRIAQEALINRLMDPTPM